MSVRARAKTKIEWATDTSGGGGEETRACPQVAQEEAHYSYYYMRGEERERERQVVAIGRAERKERLIWPMFIIFLLLAPSPIHKTVHSAQGWDI